MSYDVGFVGTGATPDDPGRDGFAMAYRHAMGYDDLDTCRLVACADVVPENAVQFASRFDVERVYEDYERMLAEATPDIVSVCVPPALHAEIVVRCAESGVVDAIHCEKPMATTWKDCRRMVETCESNGVQLSFNHQKRFAGPFRQTKQIVDDGAIGDVERIEFSAQHLFDTGSHWFDVCNYVTDGTDVEWVMGQVEYSEENVWFGAHNENHGIATWRYADGAYGLAATGDGSGMVDPKLRVCGTAGRIEVAPTNGPVLRVDRGSGWESIGTERENVHGIAPSPVERIVGRFKEAIPLLSPSEFHSADYTQRAIAEVVAALDEGRPCELNGRNALASTELIFASWESARRRGRVELPLEIDDNPLEAMIESGELNPRAT